MEDADRAVASAARALHTWGSHDNAKARSAALLKLSALVEQHARALVDAIQLDVGKPGFEAELEVQQVAAAFRYFAGLADKIHGETIPHAGSHLAFYDRVPVGVVGIISPWNFSLQLFAWRACAALACGCTVVWKPAEETLYSSLALLPLVAQALPPGVINAVQGKGSTVGMHLAKHRGVAKIAFTGSTPVGKTVAAACAESNLKHAGLELGGKSPVFVLGVPPGASIADVATTCHHAVFWNAGQCCSAGSRTYVVPELLDAFVAESVKLARAKVLGAPKDAATTMGPVINDSQKASVCAYVATAKKDSRCRVVYEGTTPTQGALARGSFVAPTIVVAPHDSVIAREEIFGPVMTIIPLPANASDDALVALANDSEFGLAGAWFGEVGRCTRLARRTESGIIWVNDFNVLGPHISFGGVKETGGSSDLGAQAVNNYTHVRMIVAKL